MKKPPDFDVSHRWKLQAQPEELTRIVLDTTAYEKWCARILMRCEVLDKGADDGLGLRLRFFTKGWLPYSFLFTATITDLVPDERMRVEVDGDFVGYGDLVIDQRDDEFCHIDLRWVTDIHHPQLRPLVRFLHPVMKGNHIWAVRWVRRMMQAEINRRRTGSDQFAAPKPTFGRFLALSRGWTNSRAKQLGWTKNLTDKA